MVTKQQKPAHTVDAQQAEARRVSDSFQDLWNQDFARAARVLRAHLVVEHFLDEYLGSINPHLGSVRDARLSFFQKLALLGDHNPLLGSMVPGLQRLNQVRNRLAHRLSVDITDEDIAVLMSVPLFAAAYKAGHRTTWMRKPNPIKAIEEFAQLSAAMLQMMAEETQAGRPWLGRERGAA